MKPSLATKAIEKCIAVKQPLFIWGPPGVGKSAVIKQIAQQSNMELIDLRLSLLDSVDLNF